MKAGVVVFPGSNCDHDCFYVLNKIFNIDTVFLWHKDRNLNNVDLIVLPGGFSFGDYLRCGAIANLSPIMNSVVDFAGKGGYVLGICNGFQILTESGLLPGFLMMNSSLNFICKDVYVKIMNNSLPFTKNYQKKEVTNIPIAHKDGNYYVDKPTYKSLEENNQIIFQYCDVNGVITKTANPNGSIGNIAGIVNIKGNVLGMMPHPERLADNVLGGREAYPLFQSIIDFLDGEV